MAFDHGESRLETSILLMDQLLDDVASGRLRVPAFQRPFEWRPDQMTDLFDSIERGYPIGSLLVWETDQPVPTLDQVGDQAQPPAPDRRSISYLLDGHQRVSTLFATLRRPVESGGVGGPADPRWRIYRDLDARDGDRYRHHRGPAALPRHYLPLRSVSKTMDFLAFSRTLERHRDLPIADLDAWITEAETVAHKIKNYQIALIKLIGGDLHQAVEVYTRLNRKGTRMAADQMVSALTYQDPGRPSLARHVDRIIATIADTGFGVVPRETVFRTVLAVAGEQDVMSPRWETVASRLETRLQEAVPATAQALIHAVDFLRETVALPLARLLPYAHQLTLLAYFFHLQPTPMVEQREELRRWFWITSWTEAFAGANSTTIRRARQDIESLAQGRSAEIYAAGMELRPMPDKFNFNSARTRAYLIWELREFPKRLDQAGIEMDPVRLIASAGAQAYRQVFEGEDSPANRVILATRSAASTRRALADIRDSFNGQRILDSHGIPVAAGDRLSEGNAHEFVEARRAFLLGRLKHFVAALGMPAQQDLVGEATEDTE